MSGSSWLFFSRPIRVISTHQPEEVISCLHQVDAHTTGDFYAAGFITYEAAVGIDPALSAHPPNGLPLIWFGIYDQYEEFTPPDRGLPPYEIGAWKPSVSLQQYRTAIGEIKDAIRRGDTYQVNYTHRLRCSFQGDPWSLFVSLHRSQRSDYSAYINLGRYHICCVSPELFFYRQGSTVTCKPMKGTVKRGRFASEDLGLQEWLRSSIKNRAENVMIVDMIRNDLGRIAEVGTVRASELFSVEKYPTVFQMTSTVSACVSVRTPEIFQQMFPCASITGAPKIETMKIIRELEPDPRGIYTGSIGYIAPDSRSQFNVAIRTVVVDMESNSAEYGVGSGIVWDSDADDEYAECGAKAEVLRHQSPEFDLVESILWTSEGGFYLLDLHIERLHSSAEYFQFNLDPKELREMLQVVAFEPCQIRQKVRIVVSRRGRISIESSSLTSIQGSTVALAKRPLRRKTAFLYHKTSHREDYADLLKEHDPHVSDLVVWNDAGLITESSIANIVIAQGGKLFTPPLEHGLLPGVLREALLREGTLTERDITVKEFLDAPTAYLINSVRGWMPLDRPSSDATWRVRSDFCYEHPEV